MDELILVKQLFFMLLLILVYKSLLHPIIEALVYASSWHNKVSITRYAPELSKDGVERRVELSDVEKWWILFHSKF